MAFQDDAREIEIRKLFKLDLPEKASRHGTDAVLKIKGKLIEFELKSTLDGKSVTTARDVGYDHLEKWKKRHWIIGVYSSARFTYAIYLPPRLLLGWIEKKSEYIQLDFEIIKMLHKKISVNEMYRLIGKKAKYSLTDVRTIQKQQFTSKEYKDLMDLKNGYSAKRVLEILHERAKYLLSRGATLNNPHIPASVVNAGFKISNDYDVKLRKLINAELTT